MSLFLYFSLTSSTLFFALGNSKTILQSIQKENLVNRSTNFIGYLKEALKKSCCDLTEIKKIYFSSGPGSQTGIRLSLVFISTLKTLNPNIKIFHLNTLLLQAGEQTCLSILNLDNSGRLWHIARYHDKKEIFSPQIKTKEEIEKIKKEFPFLTIKKNLEKLDFLNQFQKLEKDFLPLNDQEIKKIVNNFL